MNKEKIINLILKSEGGLNEQEPASVGGVSYSGITANTYQSYLPRIRAEFPDAPSSVRALDNAPAVVMKFYELYLGDYNVWILPEFLQYMYADFVTNAGAAAVKIIQKMAGCDVDGVFGTGTRKAVTEWTDKVNNQIVGDPSLDNELIMQFHDAKLEHYQNLVDKNPDKFGKWLPGWKKRANHVLAELAEYFETDGGTPSAMDEADVPTPVERTATDNDRAATPRMDTTNSIESTVIDLQNAVEDLESRVAKLEEGKSKRKKLQW